MYFAVPKFAVLVHSAQLTLCNLCWLPETCDDDHDDVAPWLSYCGTVLGCQLTVVDHGLFVGIRCRISAVGQSKPASRETEPVKSDHKNPSLDADGA
jgi:hypothetical protein